MVVKVKSVAQILLNELLIRLSGDSVELGVISPYGILAYFDFTLGVDVLVTAERIGPLNLHDGPLLLVENVILLESLSFLLRAGVWGCLYDLLWLLLLVLA